MNRSVVVTRDSRSAAFARKIGFSGKILEATDVAMCLPYQSSAEPSSEHIRVGLNISGLLMSGGYTRSNQFDLLVDYPELVRSIIRFFLTQSEVELHLVGHVQSEGFALEDDQRAAELLSSEFPTVLVAPVFASPVDAKSYISGLDFFVGSRMHATIAAFSSGVPVVPLAYSRKFAGVFGDLGYNHVVDLRAECNAVVMDLIEESFHRRDQLAKDVTKAREKVDVVLDEYRDLARRIILEL